MFLIEQNTFGFIFSWFGFSSFVCALSMYFDKRAAVKGTWRVPERTLLFWAYLGGGVGAKWVQRRFRHKTRKEPFRTLLNGALLFNGMTLIVLMVPSFRDAIADIFAEVGRTALF